MHKLLKRQLAKSKFSNVDLGVNIEQLCALVSEAYDGLYLDQKRADRANTLMTDELESLNADLTSAAQSAGQQNMWFEAAISNMPNGLALFNDKLELIIFNDNFATIYGLEPSQLYSGMPLEDQLKLRAERGIYFGDDPDDYIVNGLKAAKSTERSSNIYQLNNGQEIEIVIQPLESGGYLSTHTDITERRTAERKIHHLANIDDLTELPNRRSFFDQLELLTSINEGITAKKLVVGLLDLDGFKRINDVFGHPTGDELLIKTGERLSDVLGENIMLARLGGDEFGFILTEHDDIDDVVRIGQKICEAMAHVFHLREGSVQIAASVGFVEYPSMAHNAKLLFERAKTTCRTRHIFW